MTTSLKPIRFNKTPTQGMWVVDVEGYGELAVVHNTDMEPKRDSGELWIESNYNMFKSMGNGRSTQGAANRWMAAFNKMDFVVVQKDAAGSDSRDGYIAVFQVDEKVITEGGYSARLIQRMTK